MQLIRLARTMTIAAVAVLLAGCDIGMTVRKSAGKSIEGEVTIKASMPASLRAYANSIRAGDLYIDTAGTDFAIPATGSSAITLVDANGTVLAAAFFPWVRTGALLTYQNPGAVQAWLDHYPSAASATVQVSYGSLPSDGADHVMSTKAVYQGIARAAASATFHSDCDTRYPTEQLCRPD